MTAAAPAQAVEQALAALLEQLFAWQGTPVPRAFSRFAELARLRGATPVEGPLRHDLLLAHDSGSRALGLNFFRLPREASVDMLLELARAELPDSPLPEIEGLLAALEPSIILTPGLFFRDGQLSFKLYFDSNDPRDLPAVAAGLGLQVFSETRALAIDFGAAGFGRARQYLRLPLSASPAEAELQALGPIVERWLGARRSGSARHQLLALSSAPQAAAQTVASKRTLVQTFAPRARPAELLEFERELLACGVELGRRHAPARLAELDQLLLGYGFRLGCVAHEVDVFDSGAIDSDCFVTLVQPQA